jgi:hypothetical protein
MFSFSFGEPFPARASEALASHKPAALNVVCSRNLRRVIGLLFVFIGCAPR